MTIFYLLAIAAYALGLAVVIAFCLMAKRSSEYRFLPRASQSLERNRQAGIAPTIPVRPIPFDTPPHTRNSRKVA